MDPPTQRQLRLMGGRSNPFQTLLALFVTALFFIMFQASILKNLQRSQQMLLNSGSEQHNKGKYSHFDAIAVPGPHIARDINPKFAKKLIHEIGIKVNGTILRGVMKSHRKYYVPSKDGMFACLNGNQTVPWHAVNNDYCDCLDGSDEPGTSACKNGRFYCEPEHQYIPSSRVNDGLCDCCDGSDEWKGITVAPDLKLPDVDNVRRAPCDDVCLDYEHTKMRELNILKEGISAKATYVRVGLPHVGNGEFGPNGEFYKLSKECYVFKSPGYVYEICPFVNATQNGNDVWIIGRGGRLEGSVDKKITLTMEDGHGDHCPDGKKRKTVIAFKCAPVDQIKYVSEKETCVYAAKFDTPAACPNEEDFGRT